MVSVEQMAQAMDWVCHHFGNGVNRVELLGKCTPAGIIVCRVKDEGFMCGDREEGILVEICDNDSFYEELAENKNILDSIKFKDEYIVD